MLCLAYYCDTCSLALSPKLLNAAGEFPLFLKMICTQSLRMLHCGHSLLLDPASATTQSQQNIVLAMISSPCMPWERINIGIRTETEVAMQLINHLLVALDARLGLGQEDLNLQGGEGRLQLQPTSQQNFWQNLFDDHMDHPVQYHLGSSEIKNLMFLKCSIKFQLTVCCNLHRLKCPGEQYLVIWGFALGSVLNVLVRWGRPRVLLFYDFSSFFIH